MNAIVADNRIRRPFLGVAAIIGWISLALQLDRNLRDAHASGQTVLHAIAHFATFFTSTTNVLLAGVLTLALLGGKYAPTPSVVTAVTSYMVLVCSIFVLLLDGGRHRAGIDWIANAGVHYVMPLLALANWIVFTPHGALNWRKPFAWLIYPAGYFIYMLARGLFARDFPYWFINPAKVGWPHLLINGVALLIVFFATGQIFVFLDNRLARISGPVDAPRPPA